MSDPTCFACGREAVGVWKEETKGESGRRRLAKGRNTSWPVCETRLYGKACVSSLKLLPGERAPRLLSFVEHNLAQHYERKLRAEGL